MFHVPLNYRNNHSLSPSLWHIQTLALLNTLRHTQFKINWLFHDGFHNLDWPFEEHKKWFNIESIYGYNDVCTSASTYVFVRIYLKKIVKISTIICCFDRNECIVYGHQSFKLMAERLLALKIYLSFWIKNWNKINEHHKHPENDCKRDENTIQSNSGWFNAKTKHENFWFEMVKTDRKIAN